MQSYRDQLREIGVCGWATIAIWLASLIAFTVFIIWLLNAARECGAI